VRPVGQPFRGPGTDIATSEVTTLQHELWDDAVEFAALVAKALLTGAEGAEVFDRLGNYIIVEVEVDPALLSWRKPLSARADPEVEVIVMEGEGECVCRA